MRAHLLSLSGGPNIALDKPIMLFGRHQDCDVQLNSKKISRRHCVLAQVNDYFVIRDLGSTNGVRINGKRIAEGKLQPGDELHIGNFKYQICADFGKRTQEDSAAAYKTVPLSEAEVAEAVAEDDPTGEEHAAESV